VGPPGDDDAATAGGALGDDDGPSLRAGCAMPGE
jgi:hypothetical protein